MFENKIIPNIDNNRIESENTHDLLGKTIDSRLAFENHVNNLSKKASQNINALLEYPIIWPLIKERQ